MSRLIAALAFTCLVLAVPAGASANPASLGPHLGVNFDVDDALIGIGGRFDVANISSAAVVQLNPTFSYYFTENITLLNFSFNVPFEFIVSGSVLRPFAAPGLGIWFADWEGGSDTDLSLNLIGGLLFELDAVEPFFQLKVAVGDGSSAEIWGGVLFAL